MVAAPRLGDAMAQSAIAGRLRVGAPAISHAVGLDLAYAVLVFLLSEQGGLLRNISLATVSRLLRYGLVCGALRCPAAREGGDVGHCAGRFVTPFGDAIAAVGVVASLILFSG